MTPDERLMTALYAEHAGVLYAFARRYVHDHQRAEDVVQETLLRAWSHLDRLDVQHGNPRAYLLTTARNVLTDLWRREERRPRLVSDDDALAAVPTVDEVEAAVEGWVVHEALQRLTADHRDVVQALYYAGQSVADAARSLGVPPGTIKSRSYYAVRALRAALEEMGVVR